MSEFDDYYPDDEDDEEPEVLEEDQVLDFVAQKVREMLGRQYGFRFRDVKIFGAKTEKSGNWIGTDFLAPWDEFCLKNLGLDIDLLAKAMSELQTEFGFSGNEYVESFHELTADLLRQIRLHSIVTPEGEINPIVDEFEVRATPSIDTFINKIINRVAEVKNPDTGFNEIRVNEQGEENGYCLPSEVYKRFGPEKIEKTIPEVLTINGKKYLAFYVFPPRDETEPAKSNQPHKHENKNYFIVLDPQINKDMLSSFWSEKTYKPFRLYLTVEYLDKLQFGIVLDFIKSLLKIADLRYDEIAEPFFDANDELRILFWEQLEKYLQSGNSLQVLWSEGRGKQQVKHSLIFQEKGNRKKEIKAISIEVHSSDLEGPQLVMIHKKRRKSGEVWGFVSGGYEVGDDFNEEQKKVTLTDAELLVNRFIGNLGFQLPEDLTDFDEEKGHSALFNALDEILKCEDLPSLLFEINKRCLKSSEGSQELSVIPNQAQVHDKLTARRRLRGELGKDSDVSQN